MLEFLRRYFIRPAGCSSSDWMNLQVFAAMLFVPLFVKYMTVVTNGASYPVTVAAYMMLLVAGCVNILKVLKPTDVIIMLSIYGLFCLSFALDPSLSEYYFSTQMIIVYFVYIPLGVCYVRKIKNWEYLYDVCRIYCLAALFIAWTAVLTVDVSIYFMKQYFTYMEYSYSVLPFVLISYVLARRKKSILWFAVFLMLFASILSHGARNTILMTMCFIVAYELLSGSQLKRIVTGTAITVLGALAYLFSDKLLTLLSQLPFLSNSRFLTMAMSKSMTYGGERDLLINDCVKRLLHMELEVPGFFGDRQYISGIYPHSIIYEVLLQFGWILGILILVSFLFLSLYSIFFSKHKLTGVLLFCGLLGKFFLSSSYVMDGNFWLWLFAMFSMFNSEYAKNVCHATIRPSTDVCEPAKQ